MAGDSIRFFESQFQRQVREGDLALNPFEQLALPYLRGHILDYGCGLGNLSVAAARQGCTVEALDASPTAIGHLRDVARTEALPIAASEADLRNHALEEQYDSIVCIGLLMFFDCPAARAQLHELQRHVRAGGVAIVNVLVEGTTYRDMFDPASHCLWAEGELRECFSGWELLRWEHQEFPAPHETVKSFATLVARRPGPAS
jgi:tellurite methyltransferase